MGSKWAQNENLVLLGPPLPNGGLEIMNIYLGSVWSKKKTIAPFLARILCTFPHITFKSEQWLNVTTTLSARSPKICAKNVENHDQIAQFGLLAKKDNYLGDTNR